MKNKIIIIGFFTAALGLAGCAKFLDVTPKSSISEDQLFTSEPGFQQALIGVYSQISDRNMYGDKLTMGFVSALAQNYAVKAAYPGDGPDLVQTRLLNYDSDEVRGNINAIFKTAYAAISGANRLILNTETNRQVLSDQSYGQIRGEALALRALLHFDLLRLFGKEYVAGAKFKAIPYVKQVNEKVNVPATTEEVVDFALADLKEAEALLLKADPIVLGTVTTAVADRRNKLNYYGVKALEARIRLYKGDLTGASAAALIVTTSGKYPFITQAEASAVAASRDRLYINEQIFMIRTRQLPDFVDQYYKFKYGVDYRLTLPDPNFSTLYETASGGGTDIRYVFRIEADGGIQFPSKYWQTSGSTALTTTRLDGYVPVIRLAEMYYILAEAADNTVTGFGYLNTLRRTRGLLDLPTTGTRANLNAEILKEYQKEFYAEGQLWYYYKRKNITSMQFGATATIALSQYVLPLPLSEVEFNQNY